MYIRTSIEKREERVREKRERETASTSLYPLSYAAFSSERERESDAYMCCRAVYKYRNREREGST